MSWGEQDLDALLPELDHIPMVQLDVRVDPCLFVGCQLYVILVEDAVASHVIMMGVGIEDVGHLESQGLDPRLKFARVIAWIDHRTQAAVFIADEIAKIAIPSGFNLLENHVLLLPPGRPSCPEASSWGLSAIMSFNRAS